MNEVVAKLIVRFDISLAKPTKFRRKVRPRCQDVRPWCLRLKDATQLYHYFGLLPFILPPSISSKSQESVCTNQKLSRNIILAEAIYLRPADIARRSSSRLERHSSAYSLLVALRTFDRP